MENEIKFPDYCCFGKLQTESINETDEEMSATYQMLGWKVHELIFNKKEEKWVLLEFSPEGKRTMYSTYKTLNKTICWHMNQLDDNMNPNLQYLRKELTKLGTVWFAPFPSMKNGDISTSYSPSGKLLVVRILISAGDGSKSSMEALQKLLEYDDPETGLKLKICEFYETSCIIKKSDGTNDWHMAFVAEYLVPLAFVYDALKLFYDNGLLRKIPLNRIFIQDAPTLRDSREYGFFLTDMPGAKSYSVILKGLMISREDFKIQIKNFERENNVESF